jgi:transcription initiation factor TFIIIB Brf1 subunit/transcription initiation factor TFIIB
MDDCEHPERALIYEGSGTVCTWCGLVVDSMVLDWQPHYQESIAPRASVSVAAGQNVMRASSAAAIVQREDRRSSVDTRIVQRIVTQLQLGEMTLEMAKEIFADACEAKKATGGFRGAAYEAASASAVYYACKVDGFDRTECEVACNCGINPVHLASANKVVRRLLSRKSYGKKMLTPIKASALIPRFVATMCAPPAIIQADMKHAVQRRLLSMTLAAEAARTLEGKTPECTCIALCVLTILEVVDGSEKKEVAARCAERAGLSTGAILAAINVAERHRL